jgi:metallo-beta-lactamase family protein
MDTAKIASLDHDPHPLYTKDDVLATINLFKTIDYKEELHIGDFSILLRDAGHILGSASVEIIDQSSQGKLKKIIFSGDLGNSPQDLINPTDPVHDGDVVVMESTYGDRLHPAGNPSDLLAHEIQAVEKNGGTLLIPAFSIERSQELLHRIAHLKQKGIVKNETRVFFDSPMGEKVTQVFEHYPQLFNRELQADMRVGDPFSFPGLEILERREDSERADEVATAKVIIAGSGMMTGGRIVAHALKHLSDPKTHVLIVGYQGEETLGRELIEGKKSVLIEGQEVEVRAVITEIATMSSHADQSQLMHWLSQIQGVKKLFLTHGEDTPRKVLSQRIQQDLGIMDISMPALQDESSF